MNTIRLSKTLTASLHTLMTKQTYASQTYLSYALWAESLGYSDKANFLIRQAKDKCNQRMQILDYITERGIKDTLASVTATPENPVSIISCFEKVLRTEADNTKVICKLVKKSFDEDDWDTWNFMQFLEKAQKEEEIQVLNILKKLKIASGEKINSNAFHPYGNYLKKSSVNARSNKNMTANSF